MSTAETKNTIATVDLKSLSTPELCALFGEVEQEIARRRENKREVVSLSYNHYKGSGKCWIARVDSATKKIIDFLQSESVQRRDNYSGQKTFSVPITEGTCYLFCESGSKSNDSRSYRKVINGELVYF